MKKSPVIVILALFALIANASASHAQWHSRDSRMYYDYGDPIMTNTIQSPDGHTAEVRLTTANSMFSFLRLKNSSSGKYYALRDITIEVTQQGNEQPLVTKNELDTLYANTFDESTSKTTWHAISRSIALPQLDSNKKYSLRIEVRDGVDRLASRPISYDLRPTSFTSTANKSGIAIGDITLTDSVKQGVAYTGAKANTYMFSRNVKGSVAFKVADAFAGQPMVDIRVRQVTNLISPTDTGERYHAVLDIGDLHRSSAYALVGNDSELEYQLKPTQDPELWTADFNIPGEEFNQGKYEISVRVREGDIEQTRTNNFMLVWQGQPLSLEDPTDAIEPLQYLLQPDAWKAMSSGTKQEMTTKLYKYWQTQDPTPGTAFNERMATFYERVDYADFNFATTRFLNGAMTDRGKIYLLYGPPTHTERTFIPGEVPTETWTYANNVHRIFRFEARNQPGDYTLAEIKDLATKD